MAILTATATKWYNTGTNHIGNLNPFRYRGYYYDRETGLYFLQTRYYDPEIGRFLNRDSVAYADPQTINGLNLYAYCLNNPVAYVDPTGKSAILIALILGAFAITGGVIGGKLAYDKNVAEGKTGSDLFWSTIGGIGIGFAFGLATGGAVVSLGAVISGALAAIGIGSGTFLGVSALQAFSIGALAFDFTAFVVAPIIGVSMEGIEYENNPIVIPKPQRTPIPYAKINSISSYKHSKNSISVFNSLTFYI